MNLKRHSFHKPDDAPRHIRHIRSFHPLWRSSVIALLTVTAIGCFWTAAAPVKFEMPPETAQFKPGAGMEIAKSQCLLCHSSEYVSMQPRLPRAFWEANIKKMREKYGAPIPSDQVEPLLKYLVGSYGTDR
jgi:hypothetical protein